MFDVAPGWVRADMGRGLVQDHRADVRPPLISDQLFKVELEESGCVACTLVATSGKGKRASATNRRRQANAACQTEAVERLRHKRTMEASDRACNRGPSRLPRPW